MTKPFIFSYIRVSSKHQETGDGPERQSLAIARWCEAKGYDGPNFAGQDMGISGTKDSAARPGLSRIIDAIRARREANWQPGREILLVVERPDRLARDLVVGELILDELRSMDVKVISAEGDLDLTNDADPTRILVRQIMSAICEYEKSSIVVKLRRARERRRLRDGRCEGAKPFGTLEGEGLALEAIRTLHRAGFGASQIAAQLNAHNRGEWHFNLEMNTLYPPRSGKKWWRSAVAKILERHKA